MLNPIDRISVNFLERLNVYFYHSDREKKWTEDPARILGWSSEQTQFARFSVFEKSLNLRDKSILDLGCGYGDLVHFLRVKQPIKHYTGIDFHKSFIKQAKLNADDSMRFLHGNFAQMRLPVHDITIASGSLNYRSNNKNYLPTVIRAGFSASREAFGFNLLDSDYFREDRLLQAYDPKEVLSICRNLTDDVEIIRDYMEEDFTIIMKPS
ncbi:class I SAM-dependent methyltransferase [Vibrio nigripulchritudo]|uniref:class I SAM-dependent methyltransferase n=1 Tax=Vibrio nigripulchritudo TaxID=28173 RepID=UPI001E2B4FFF|nr:class I SAM-dependent methyltransferase [Vibrio nigripulchritudo]